MRYSNQSDVHCFTLNTFALTFPYRYPMSLLCVYEILNVLFFSFHFVLQYVMRSTICGSVEIFLIISSSFYRFFRPYFFHVWVYNNHPPSFLRLFFCIALELHSMVIFGILNEYKDCCRLHFVTILHTTDSVVLNRCFSLYNV